MTDLEMRALSALAKLTRWKLNDERCWCPCARVKAWQAGTKQHTPFCKEASAVYGDLLDAAVENPFPPQMAERAKAARASR